MDHRVYRAFDCEGDLLYVGYSGRAFARVSEHLDRAAWSGQVSTITFEQYDAKDAALDAEAAAISSENPTYNVIRPAPKAALHTDAVIDDICQRVWHCWAWKRDYRASLISQLTNKPHTVEEVEAAYGRTVNNQVPL